MGPLYGIHRVCPIPTCPVFHHYAIPQEAIELVQKLGYREFDDRRGMLATVCAMKVVALES